MVCAIAILLSHGDKSMGKPLPLRPAPEFTQTDPKAWINSAPLTMQDLRGQVVLLDIWTFECWNCYRSFPWLNALETKYGPRGLQVVGIHSPEFERERQRGRVIEKVAEFGLHHPVMMDNDFAYWRALSNRYWPAFYLIDKRGMLRALFIGETHVDSKQARAIEAMLEQLLAAPS